MPENSRTDLENLLYKNYLTVPYVDIGSRSQYCLRHARDSALRVRALEFSPNWRGSSLTCAPTLSVRCGTIHIYTIENNANTAHKCERFRNCRKTVAPKNTSCIFYCFTDTEPVDTLQCVTEQPITKPVEKVFYTYYFSQLW